MDRKSRIILTWVIICLMLGFASGMSSNHAITNWYADLNKPFFSPPNWIFGPVWSLLYILMGVAVGRVQGIGLDNLLAKKGVGFFIMQFIMNLIWTPVFFALKQPMLALGIIIVLWIMIFMTIRAFRQVDKTSALLMYPYLMWVSFATALNGAIVMLN